MNDDKIIDNSFEVLENKKRRRALLPWWIKVFCLISMVFGILAFVCLILGFTNVKPALAFYGFESNEPFSLNGLIIIAAGILKGATAYSLWYEKDFAIKLGKIDAIIGIILCIITMLIIPSLTPGFHIQFRLELVLLIAFLWKLNQIEEEWEA